MNPEVRTLLAELLEKRLAVIADHEWRDRDESAHLAALVEAGEAVDEWKKAHLSEVEPRLRHFLEGCSYDKALAWIAERS